MERQMEKGDIIKLTIEDLIDDGRGFARYEGLAVFVAGAVPGDIVEARVTKVKKNIAEAEVQQLTEPSPDRVRALCPHFGKCGGCSLQELTYDAQLRLKTKHVTSKLERLGGIEDPIVRPIIRTMMLAKKPTNRETLVP